jgi:hypothetical protein
MSFGAVDQLKKDFPRAPPRHPEAHAIMALGLTLQFPHKFPGFTWAQGSVAIGMQSRPDYAPWHPLEGGRKRSIAALQRKAKKYLRE